MTEKNIIVSNSKEFIHNLTYIHVAAHLLSRGILTMQEHRKIMQIEELNRVSALLDIIKTRDNASRHLIDAMRDPDLKGVYSKLVNKLE